MTTRRSRSSSPRTSIRRSGSSAPSRRRAKVATTVQPALATAKSRVHSSVAPIVTAIKADQERFARLKFVTPQDEDNELEHLKLIEIIALGDGHSAGTISVTCQTVLITITQTIQITIVQTTPAPCPPREERDDD